MRQRCWHEFFRERLNEPLGTLGIKAYLSVIVMCGSILEATLAGAVEQAKERLDQKPGRPKNLNDWSLSELIKAAEEVGVLKRDAVKLSQILQDFRNNIHPYKQLKYGFKLNGDHAIACFKVLKIALTRILHECPGLARNPAFSGPIGA